MEYENESAMSIKSRRLSEEDYRDIFFAIIAIFVIGEMWIISTHFETLMKAPLWYWMVMPFATVMAARTITFYGVAHFIRRWFVYMKVDSCHAGENSEPRPGLVEPLGWLLQCPICTGMHSASILVLLYCLAPNFGITVAIMLAIAAGSMLLNHLAECLSWGSRLFRVGSGLISPDPETPGYEVRQNIYRIISNKVRSEK